MRIRFAAAAVVVAMPLLGACGGQATTVAEPADSPVTSSASAVTPTASAVVPARGSTPSRDFVVGRWGTDGDCELAIDLRADGTSDGPFGDWSYADGVIGFTDEPDFKVTVTVIDATTMESTNATGKTARMTRCP